MSDPNDDPVEPWLDAALGRREGMHLIDNHPAQAAKEAFGHRTAEKDSETFRSREQEVGRIFAEGAALARRRVAAAAGQPRRRGWIASQ